MMTLVSTHYHDDPNAVIQRFLNVVPHAGKYPCGPIVKNFSIPQNELLLHTCTTKGIEGLIQRVAIRD